MNANETPLLPPWADDETVGRVMTQLFGEIEAHFRIFESRIRRDTPVLIRETETMLRHAAEGW